MGYEMLHLLMSLWRARLAEGSALRTRASDAGWLNGNISKRAVDPVPCLRFAPLRSQISSSFGSSATPLFPLDSFFEHMRHRCIQNSLLPVPIEYILVQRVLRPAEAVETGVCDGRGLVTPPRPDRATRPPRSGRIRKEPSRGHGCLTRRLV